DKDGVQIQLIPSAGMSIMPDRCVNDAIVFNVDGGAPAAPPHIDLVVNDGSGGHVDEYRKVRAPAAQTYFPEDGYLHFYKPRAIPGVAEGTGGTGTASSTPGRLGASRVLRGALGEGTRGGMQYNDLPETITAWRAVWQRHGLGPAISGHPLIVFQAA